MADLSIGPLDVLTFDDEPNRVWLSVGSGAVGSPDGRLFCDDWMTRNDATKLGQELITAADRGEDTRG